MPHEFEVRIAQQRFHIAAGASEEVVDADDLVPVCEQTFTQVRAQKAGASGNQDPLRRGVGVFVHVRKIVAAVRAPKEYSTWVWLKQRDVAFAGVFATNQDAAVSLDPCVGGKPGFWSALDSDANFRRDAAMC